MQLTTEQQQQIRQGDKGVLINYISDLLEELGAEPENEVYKRGYFTGIEEVNTFFKKFTEQFVTIHPQVKVFQAELINQFSTWLQTEFPNI